MKKTIIALLASLLTVGIYVTGCNQGTTATPPEIEWEKTFGTPYIDVVRDAQQTSDGGFIIAGVTESYEAGKWDVWLVKLNASGDHEWSRTFGGSEDDGATDVKQTSDGGYIIVGGTKSFGAGEMDMWLIRTDAEGDEQWFKTYGGRDYELAYSVQQTSDGGYIIAGGQNRGLDSDVTVIKTNVAGNEEWRKTFGGTGTDEAYSVIQTLDGGYVMAGLLPTSYEEGELEAWLEGPKEQAFLSKVNEHGEEEWTKTFGGTGWDQANYVQQTADGGYIIAGRTRSYGAGGSDAWLIKTDEAGDELWSMTYGGADLEDALYVLQTLDGGYLLAGSSTSYGNSPFSDSMIVKTDKAGQEEWKKVFGGSGTDQAVYVTQMPDGVFVVIGTSESDDIDPQYGWIIKLK